MLSIMKRMEQNRLKRFGNVERMTEDEVVKTVFHADVKRNRWKDVVE